MKKVLLKTIPLIFILLLFNVSVYSQWSAAAKFNGTSSYIAVPNDVEISPAAAITIEAWVYLTSNTGNPTICGKSFLSSYWFGFQGSRLRFYPKGGSGQQLEGNQSLPLNTWTHVAATYDGVTTALYVNGVLESSTTIYTGPIGQNNDSLFIGCDRYGLMKDYFFNGKIDNIRIWNVARTQVELVNNMYIPLEIRKPSGQLSGLAASYEFNYGPVDYSGSVCNDGINHNIEYETLLQQNHIDWNNSLVLDGNSNCVSPNSIDFNCTSGLTIETWIRWDTTGTEPETMNLINKSSATWFDYALYLTNTGVPFISINFGQTYISAPSALTPGQWTHIAATYSASTGTLRLYINGVLVRSGYSAAEPIQNHPDSLYIGGYSSPFQQYRFKGQMDEIRIWKDSVRTQQQILENMYKGRDFSEFAFSSYSFNDLSNIPVATNGGFDLNAALQFRGNARISSQRKNNDQELTAPLLHQAGDYYTQYKINSGGILLPDFNLYVDSIYVNDDINVSGVELFTLINHTRVRDLLLKLINPQGTFVQITPGAGSEEGNDLMTIFSESAEYSIQYDGMGVKPPFSNRIKPAAPFSFFIGPKSKGWWKLQIHDHVSGHRGYLHRWGIKISGAVPVELSSFTAAINKKDVVLNWTTITETNNKGFEIERSAAVNKPDTDKNWSSVSFVAGKGTTTEPQNYVYTDKNAAPGKYLYRLKQIDMDGTYKYSNEVEVSIGSPAEFALNQNYPNPFNPTTVISWQIPVSGHVTLKLFDMLGKEVATLVDENREAGYYTTPVDGSKLSCGIYIFQLNAGSFSQSRKMVLMK